MLTFPASPEILTTPYRFSAEWNGRLDLRELPEAPTLPEKLKSASPKRIAEFLAGRFCAAKAIQAFHPDWSGQIGMNPDGSPQWPEGLAGSITHTEGYAAAAVAPTDAWRSLGIDSEKITDPTALDAAREIPLSADERRHGAQCSIPEDHFMLLIFSAKESIYKCLYPVMKPPLELSALILDDINISHRRFRFHLAGVAPADFLNSIHAQGRFAFTSDYVHTGVELRHLL